MATTANSTQFPTLTDVIQRMDPNGAVAQVIETLAQLNPIVRDAVVTEGNLPDGHKFISREALPTIHKRRYNEGVPASKSTTAPTTEAVAMFNAQSKVDVELANLNGNAAAFRHSEDVSFVDAMNQTVEESVIYDSSADDPSTLTGLLPRLDSTSGAAGKQIVKWGAGGANNNASMLLVGWGKRQVHLFYPKGANGGLAMKDMGEQLVLDANNNTFRAFVSDWVWKLGVAVEDKRYIAAVRNIDMGTITGGTAAAPVNDLILACVDAYYKIFRPAAVKLVWYAPRALAAILHKQALSSVSHSTLTIDEVAGRPVTKLMGVPIEISDARTATEPAIT